MVNIISLLHFHRHIKDNQAPDKRNISTILNGKHSKHYIAFATLHFFHKPKPLRSAQGEVEPTKVYFIYRKCLYMSGETTYWVPQSIFNSIVPAIIPSFLRLFTAFGHPHFWDPCTTGLPSVSKMLPHSRNTETLGRVIAKRGIDLK